MFTVINGKECSVDDKLISFLLYGYGVYTSFVVQDGKTRYWDAHLDRVINDAKKFLGIEVTREQITSSVNEFLNKSYEGNAISCRVTIFAEDFSLANPQLVKIPTIMVTGKQGGGSVTASAVKLKTLPCKRSNTQHKVTNNIAAAAKIRAIAKNMGLNDALICNDGIISEGTTWNIFFVKGEKIITPNMDSEILPGITRKICIDYFGDKIIERSVSIEELNDFDAAFITNAAIAAVPVIEIDNIGFELNNSIVIDFQNYYKNMKQQKIS